MAPFSTAKTLFLAAKLVPFSTAISTQRRMPRQHVAAGVNPQTRRCQPRRQTSPRDPQRRMPRQHLAAGVNPQTWVSTRRQTPPRVPQRRSRDSTPALNATMRCIRPIATVAFATRDHERDTNCGLKPAATCYRRYATPPTSHSRLPAANAATAPSCGCQPADA